MLVLSRRQGESLVIKTSDGNIEITVLDKRGNAIRAGIEAPRKCAIYRRELMQNANNNDTRISSKKQDKDVTSFKEADHE